MEHKITVIYPNSLFSAEMVGEADLLPALQKAVGGYIEAIPGFTAFQNEPCEAYCNEEGKLQGLAINTIATDLWLKQNPADDILVGPVVLVQPPHG